ncbi:hypothetical protein BDU57DRAFT_524024, partial [Ampelomyces quisqualis]
MLSQRHRCSHRFPLHCFLLLLFPRLFFLVLASMALRGVSSCFILTRGKGGGPSPWTASISTASVSDLCNNPRVWIGFCTSGVFLRLPVCRAVRFLFMALVCFCAIALSVLDRGWNRDRMIYVFMSERDTLLL